MPLTPHKNMSTEHGELNSKLVTKYSWQLEKIEYKYVFVVIAITLHNITKLKRARRVAFNEK